MISSLPGTLAMTLSAEISRFSTADLRHAAERMSEAYRGKAPIRKALSDIERAAYLAVRFPSTFAVAHHVWQEIAQLIPAISVASVLDAGSGPGTASLAGHIVMDAKTKFTRLERDDGWRALSGRLAEGAGIAGDFLQGAISRDMTLPVYDAVLACYALGELPLAERNASIPALWSLAGKMLVVIEPGTPDGFETIERVRRHALASGGHAAAPCAHDAPCPMSRADWCHRPVRVARSAVHREVKGADLSYEDEKFAYVVMTREPPERRAPARIVRKPIINKGHLHLDGCEAGAIKRRTISRSDGPLYRAARDASWGDLWPPQDE
jgi:ribosomal protein RSM22 (predicted rRNA methylase)